MVYGMKLVTITLGTYHPTMLVFMPLLLVLTGAHELHTHLFFSTKEKKPAPCFETFSMSSIALPPKPKRLLVAHRPPIKNSKRKRELSSKRIKRKSIHRRTLFLLIRCPLPMIGNLLVQSTRLHQRRKRKGFTILSRCPLTTMFNNQVQCKILYQMRRTRTRFAIWLRFSLTKSMLQKIGLYTPSISLFTLTTIL